MTDKRQEATKLIYNHDRQYLLNTVYSSLEEVFEFCWGSFANNEHNILLKLTRRNIKLKKFAFGTPWLPDLLCKCWFMSSVWNFYRWVTDVPPRETFQAVRSEEKQLFSQARPFDSGWNFGILGDEADEMYLLQPLQWQQQEFYWWYQFDARAFSLTSFEAYSSFCRQIRLLGCLFLSKEPQDLNN